MPQLLSTLDFVVICATFVFLKNLANLVEAHVEVRAVEFLQEDQFVNMRYIMEIGCLRGCLNAFFSSLNFRHLSLITLKYSTRLVPLFTCHYSIFFNCLWAHTLIQCQLTFLSPFLFFFPASPLRFSLLFSSFSLVFLYFSLYPC